VLLTATVTGRCVRYYNGSPSNSTDTRGYRDSIIIIIMIIVIMRSGLLELSPMLLDYVQLIDTLY